MHPLAVDFAFAVLHTLINIPIGLPKDAGVLFRSERYVSEYFVRRSRSYDRNGVSLDHSEGMKECEERPHRAPSLSSSDWAQFRKPMRVMPGLRNERRDLIDVLDPQFGMFS